jgi:hypothetical protein
MHTKYSTMVANLLAPAPREEMSRFNAEWKHVYRELADGPECKQFTLLADCTCRQGAVCICEPELQPEDVQIIHACNNKKLYGRTICWALQKALTMRLENARCLDMCLIRELTTASKEPTHGLFTEAKDSSQSANRSSECGLHH